MSLLQTLEKQHNALFEMSELLTQELDAISSRDHELLLSVVETKRALLTQIEQQDKAIATLIANHDTTEMHEFEPLINKINSQLLACKKQNDVNQVAANQSQIASNKLKDILFGKSQGGYDKSGKATSLPNPIARGLKA